MRPFCSMKSPLLSIIMTLTAYTWSAYALPNPPDTSVSASYTKRAPTTCADPSLAKPVFQAFSGPSKTHILNFHWALIHFDTAQSTDFWMIQGPVFLAWEDQQPFTVPLFQLRTADGEEYMYAVGPDADTPPSVSGFPITGIVGWVYDSPVCGSVPLMTVAFPAASDHYYTTDADERARLLGVDSGWADGGTVAFVLPLHV